MTNNYFRVPGGDEVFFDDLDRASIEAAWGRIAPQVRDVEGLRTEAEGRAKAIVRAMALVRAADVAPGDDLLAFIKEISAT